MGVSRFSADVISRYQMPAAFGGYVKESGGYRIHIFLNDDSFLNESSINFYSFVCLCD